MENLLTLFLNEIFSSPLKTVADSLTMDITENGMFAKGWTIVEAVFNDILLPIGITLMVIYFIAALIDKSSTGQFNFEVFFKCFIQLIVATVLISNLMAIVNIILSVGYSLIFKLQSVAGANWSTDFYAEVFESVYKELGTVFGFDFSDVPVLGAAIKAFNVNNPIKMIPLIISLLIPYIMSLIIRLGVMLLSYTRVIELMISVMFMPLCMGDIFTDGIHGAAMRNIKRLFAVSLQGFAIYAVAILYSFIASGILTSASGAMQSIFANVVLGAAALASMFKASQFCKDALGVH